MKKVIYILSVVVVIGILFLGLKSLSGKDVSVLPLSKNLIEKQYYNMDLNIPNQEFAKSNFGEMFDFIKTSISEFDRDFGDISKEDAEIMGFNDGRKYEFLIDTKISTTSKTVSYILETYTYTGGAHGGTSIAVFTYDKENRLVTTSDIFNTIEWQKIISEKARIYFKEKLVEYLDQQSLFIGTEPNKDNFNVWYLDGDNIVFVFGQYQIGPYVLGIQEFPVSLSSISDIVKPDILDEY